MSTSRSSKLLEELLAFVNSSSSPFHAVNAVQKRIEDNDFERIMERDPWDKTLVTGRRYYVTRNGSSIIAFATGRKWKPGNPIAIIGAHTDSPGLRIKPISKRVNEDFLQVAVERYSGALWHTWFDRDLSMAGRVMVRSHGPLQADSWRELVHQCLVKVERPIFRIPTLAVHLDRQESFQFSREDHLLPIAGLIQAQGYGTNQMAHDVGSPARQNPLPSPEQRHHQPLLETIAAECGIKAEDIIDFEMMLYDTQKAVLGGLSHEFIFGSRLDNLIMSFCAVEGLLQSLSTPGAEDDDTIRLVALFDDEEIGSQTAQGAASNFLSSVIRRICLLQRSDIALNDEDDVLLSATTYYEQTLSRSFVISADMAHSVHPNYSSKYETGHRPRMNGGVVIKINARGHYCADAPGIALLEEVARRARRSSTDTVKTCGVPLQLFVVRNDSSCGSTNGPIIAAALGVRTIDVGNAQLSMHSIRETAGSHDIEYAVNLFESFFTHYRALERAIEMD